MLLVNFQKALRESNYRVIESMIKDHKQLLENENPMGDTPILSAIRDNNLNVIEFLLDKYHNIDFNVLTKVKENVIFLAINKMREPNIINILLQANPELLFSKYRGTSQNTDLQGSTPTKYVLEVLDRAREENDPFKVEYYDRVFGILDSFYTDYETYYLRGNGEQMRITRQGNFRRPFFNPFLRRTRRAAQTRANVAQPQTRRISSSSSGTTSSSSTSRSSSTGRGDGIPLSSVLPSNRSSPSRGSSRSSRSSRSRGSSRGTLSRGSSRGTSAVVVAVVP